MLTIFLLCLGYVILCYFLRSDDEDAADDADTDTEFTAEVVRIVNVRAHPNADRLEVADFELARSGTAAYEVVVGKGDFHPGDLARYYSVDCLLPLDRQEFAFLKSKDHPNRTHHRLRAARLRGVYSQGLLVAPQSKDELGDRVAASSGVSYYRPESAEPDEVTDEVKAPPFAPHYGVDSLKKLPRLFQPDDVVLVTEKVDGCNARFGWKRQGLLRRWKFKLGSHRCDIDPDGDSPFAIAARLLNLAERTASRKGLIFYGELYGLWHTGAKIQDLTYGLNCTEVVVFDVRDTRTGHWMPALDRINLLEEMRLPQPPKLARVKYGDGSVTRGLADGPSCLYASQIREGSVVEAVDGPRRKAKYVGEGYLMRDSKPKGKVVTTLLTGPEKAA